MPITYESPAPVAAYGSVYADAARIAAQQRNAQLAAAASQGGGYGRGGNVPYDTGIQDAMNVQGQLQLQHEALNRRGEVTPADAFQAQTTVNLQRDRFQLEANLQSVQLTQQENMRLQRMRNAIGDVSNDPSLSLEEKNDMIVQLKTGIDPLIRRQAQAKIEADKQIKEQHAQLFQFQAASEKMRLDNLGKSPADRTGFVPDPMQLSAIADDIAQNADLPAMTPHERDALVSKMAIQEAMRQGLGTHVLTHADGRETILSGIGSKAHDATGTSGKIGGADHPTGLSPMDYLKAREQAEAQAHKEQQLTTTNDIGTKTNTHPQSIEWKNERTRQIMQSLGLPKDMNEYNQQRDKAVARGYDPSKSAWNKGKQQPLAAAATPTGSQSQDRIATINKGANEQANAVLVDNRIPPTVRTQMADRIGFIRRILTDAGGSESNIPEDKKAEYEAAKKFIQDNDPDAGKAGRPAAQQSATGQPEKPWYQKVAAGEYGKETLDIGGIVRAADLTNPETRKAFGRGARRIGEAIRPNLGKFAERLGGK